eukprot:SAG25_NODE_153_length_13583_cov_199.837659_7_plen_103_part_00
MGLDHRDGLAGEHRRAVLALVLPRNLRAIRTAAEAGITPKVVRLATWEDGGCWVRAGEMGAAEPNSVLRRSRVSSVSVSYCAHWTPLTDRDFLRMAIGSAAG